MTDTYSESRPISRRPDGKCSIMTQHTSPHKDSKKPAYRKPQAVRELEDAYTAYHYRRHASIPPESRVKFKYRDDTANGLTKCIIAYLRLHDCQAERINTTGIPVDNRRTVTDILGNARVYGSIEWRPSTSPRGSADISAIIAGRAVKIEVKIGRDRQSEYQRQYQRDVEAAGGVYYIARDFASFVEFTKGLGL